MAGDRRRRQVHLAGKMTRGPQSKGFTKGCWSSGVGGKGFALGFGVDYTKFTTGGGGARLSLPTHQSFSSSAHNGNDRTQEATDLSSQVHGDYFSYSTHAGDSGAWAFVPFWIWIKSLNILVSLLCRRLWWGRSGKMNRNSSRLLCSGLEGNGLE